MVQYLSLLCTHFKHSTPLPYIPYTPSQPRTMSPPIDPGHFFQTESVFFSSFSSFQIRIYIQTISWSKSNNNQSPTLLYSRTSISESSRKANKAQNTSGDPIRLPSKILAVIADPHDPGNRVYVAESAGVIRRVILDVCVCLCLCLFSFLFPFFPFFLWIVYHPISSMFFPIWFYMFILYTLWLDEKKERRERKMYKAVKTG